MPLRTRSPASVDVSPQRVRADHERGAAGARLGQQVLERAADGHHVAERRADADLPQPRHVVLGCAARIVGRDRPLRLPASRSASTASTARGVGSSPIQTQPSRSRMNWS